jgi:cell wall-associated NlpC family hydrolase
MSRMSRPMGAVCVLIVVSLAVALGTTAPAAADSNFPSWAEVQAAQKNVRTKNAEIAKISKIVAALQSQSAAAGKVALIRGEEYLQAKNALASATAAATKLKIQSDAAGARARTSARQAGELAAQLARQGAGSGLTIELLMGKHPSNLLDALGTASKLTESTAAVFATAQADQRTAAALGAQAIVAKKVRARRATDATSALAAAKRASDQSEHKVTVESKQQTVLSAQLASLSGVSAKVEAGYLAGVAWEKKQAAKKTPPPDGPPLGGGGSGGGSDSGGSGGGDSGGSGGSGGGTGGEPTPPPAPNGSAVAGAISFARAQLGKPYRLDGSGPTYWDCSGLTQAAYAAVGVYIGTHSSTNQYNTLRAEGKLVPLSARQAGDLLWYSDGGSTTAVKYHVALYIGGGEMIEAPYPGTDVRIAAIRYGDLVPYAGRPTE